MHFRKISLLFLTALVAIALLEFIGWVGASSLKLNQHGTYASAYRTFLDSNGFGRWTATETVNERFAPHPFWGYRQIKRSGFPTNKDGFIATYEYDGRFDKSEEYVVGILGGSVAQNLALYLNENPGQVQKLERALGGILGHRKIRIMNLAVSGFKQPQQFMISAYYKDKIDLSLNLDGFNELEADHFPDYPLEYPFFSRVYYGGMGPYFQLFLARNLFRATTQMARAGSEAGIFSHSSLYFMSWTAVKRVYESLSARLSEYPSRQKYYPEGSKLLDAEARNEQMAATWAKYLRYQHLLYSAARTPALFWLQPNQHFEGSKTLTPEEASGAISEWGLQRAARGYPKLLDQLRRLQKSEIPVYDLTGIFHDVADTIYIDRCCHVNAKGNEIIWDAMVRQITQYFKANRSLFLPAM